MRLAELHSLILGLAGSIEDAKAMVSDWTTNYAQAPPPGLEFVVECARHFTADIVFDPQSHICCCNSPLVTAVAIIAHEASEEGGKTRPKDFIKVAVLRSSIQSWADTSFI